MYKLKKITYIRWNFSDIIQDTIWNFFHNSHFCNYIDAKGEKYKLSTSNFKLT